MDRFSYSAYRERRLRKSALAEGEGFEPPKACTLVVFKTTAIDHSAIPPAILNNTVGYPPKTLFKNTDPTSSLGTRYWTNRFVSGSRVIVSEYPRPGSASEGMSRQKS